MESPRNVPPHKNRHHCGHLQLSTHNSGHSSASHHAVRSTRRDTRVTTHVRAQDCSSLSSTSPTAIPVRILREVDRVRAGKAQCVESPRNVPPHKNRHHCGHLQLSTHNSGHSLFLLLHSLFFFFFTLSFSSSSLSLFFSSSLSFFFSSSLQEYTSKVHISSIIVARRPVYAKLALWFLHHPAWWRATRVGPG